MPASVLHPRNTMELSDFNLHRNHQAIPAQKFRERRMTTSSTDSSDSSGSLSSESSSGTAVHIPKLHPGKTVDPPTLEEFERFESHIREAMSDAKMLQRLVLLKPPADLLDNEMIKDFGQKCQLHSRRVRKYMKHPALLARTDICRTKQVLAQTEEQLDQAIGKHQKAVVNALRLMGVSQSQLETALGQTNSDVATPDTPTQQSVTGGPSFSLSQQESSTPVSEFFSASDSSGSERPSSDADGDTSSAQSVCKTLIHKSGEEQSRKQSPSDEEQSKKQSPSDEEQSKKQTPENEDELGRFRRHALRLMFLTRLDRIPAAYSEYGSTNGLTLPQSITRPGLNNVSERKASSLRFPGPTPTTRSFRFYSVNRSLSEPSLRLQRSFTARDLIATRTPSPDGTPSSRPRSLVRWKFGSRLPSSSQRDFNDRSCETSDRSSASGVTGFNLEVQKLRQQIAVLGQRLELSSAAQRAESALNRLMWKRLLYIGDESVQPSGEILRFAKRVMSDMVAPGTSSYNLAAAMPSQPREEMNVFSHVDWSRAGIGPREPATSKEKQRLVYHRRVDSGYGPSTDSACASKPASASRNSTIMERICRFPAA